MRTRERKSVRVRARGVVSLSATDKNKRKRHDKFFSLFGEKKRKTLVRQKAQKANTKEKAALFKHETHLPMHGVVGLG